ncbi:MAG: Holliday junction resolvase [Treponema sp.]|nr:Holliday junction resolvase [Treponema sp.]
MTELSLEKLISSQLVTIGIIGLGFFLVLVIAIAVAFKAGKSAAKIALRGELKKVREDALKRSRAVLGGQAGEQVAPFLPHFPCNPADARFVGKPIDFIAFPGAAEGEPIDEVLLIEVKTGDAQLSQRERQIRDAVEDGRVRYVEYRVP